MLQWAFTKRDEPAARLGDPKHFAPGSRLRPKRSLLEMLEIEPKGHFGISTLSFTIPGGTLEHFLLNPRITFAIDSVFVPHWYIPIRRLHGALEIRG